ncbi:MAG: hypothetical protein HZC29_01215 [Thaumarchaeota archaeon]|nr:hypothetical protein [Nitrososphaerota archaeon]
MSDFWFGFVCCALVCGPFLTYLGLLQFHQWKLKQEMNKIKSEPEPQIMIDQETQDVIAEAEQVLQQATG